MSKKVTGVFSTNKGKTEVVKGAKKTVILLLIVLISVASQMLLALLSVFLFALLYGLAILPIGILFVAYIALILFARKRLERRYTLRQTQILPCIGVPPLLCSGGYLLLIQKLQDMGHWEGQWFGGLGETVFGLSFCLWSALVILTLIFVFVIDIVQKQQKTGL